jgi:hypothetical protein
MTDPQFSKEMLNACRAWAEAAGNLQRNALVADWAANISCPDSIFESMPDALSAVLTEVYVFA